MKIFVMRSAIFPESGGGYMVTSGGGIVAGGLVVLGMEKCVFCSKKQSLKPFEETATKVLQSGPVQTQESEGWVKLPKVHQNKKTKEKFQQTAYFKRF